MAYPERYIPFSLTESTHSIQDNHRCSEPCEHPLIHHSYESSQTVCLIHMQMQSHMIQNENEHLVCLVHNLSVLLRVH